MRSIAKRRAVPPDELEQATLENADSPNITPPIKSGWAESTMMLSIGTPTVGLPEIPRDIGSPSALKVHEALLTNIRTYILGSFDSHFWISLGESRMCTRTTQTISSGLGSLYDHMRFACDLFKQRKPVQAGQHLSCGFQSVERILKYQAPDMLALLLRTLAYLNTQGYPNIARLLCQYFAQRTSGMFKEQDHPLRHIFPRLSRLLDDGIDDKPLLVLETIGFVFAQALGPQHMHSVYTTHVILDTKRLIHGPEAVSHQLAGTLEDCTRLCGPKSIQTLQVMVDWATNLLDVRKPSQALAVGITVMQCTLSLINSPDCDAKKLMNIHVESHRVLAQAYTGLARYVEAESHFVTAMKICQSGLGPFHSTTIKCQNTYEKWLRERGRKDEATRLRARTLAVVSRIVDDETSRLAGAIVTDGPLQRPFDGV